VLKLEVIKFLFILFYLSAVLYITTRKKQKRKIKLLTIFKKRLKPRFPKMSFGTPRKKYKKSC
jgi:hypothetical protein